jgi:hypothetical protein
MSQNTHLAAAVQSIDGTPSGTQLAKCRHLDDDVVLAIGGDDKNSRGIGLLSIDAQNFFAAKQLAVAMAVIELLVAMHATNIANIFLLAALAGRAA